MARKTKEEALKTREAIIDAAVQVFLIQGVSRTTLAQIAKAAGVTRGAIYWHFENKEDLLAALWEQLLLPFEPINMVVDNPDEPDPLGKLMHAYLTFFRSLKEDSRILQLFQILIHKCEAVEDTGTLQLNRVNCHRDGQRKIENVLRKAVQRGQLPENLDVRMGSIATISFIDGLIHNWIMFPDLLDVRKDIPAMLNGLTHMLRSGFSQSIEAQESTSSMLPLSQSTKNTV
jgi:TetR/AcrR family acrAB operon transcriptional repressor